MSVQRSRVDSIVWVIAACLRMKGLVGADDFLLLCHFEMPGLRGEEVEEQMSLFAEQVMPELRRACGGSPELPESTVELVPHQRMRA